LLDRNLLDRDGIQQIERLAQNLKKKLSGSFYLAASDARRAIESARILSKNLDSSASDIEHILELLGEASPTQLKTIDDKVKEQTADNIILVGHHPAVSQYANYFLDKELGYGNPIGKISEGNGVLIDLEKEDYEFVP
jgi:phosphohistidine phosphatase SixA